FEHPDVELDESLRLDAGGILHLYELAPGRGEARAKLRVVKQRRQAARKIRDVPEARLVARLEMAHHVGDPARVERYARRAAGECLWSRLRLNVRSRRDGEDIGRAVGSGQQIVVDNTAEPADLVALWCLSPA